MMDALRDERSGKRARRALTNSYTCPCSTIERPLSSNIWGRGTKKRGKFVLQTCLETLSSCKLAVVGEKFIPCDDNFVLGHRGENLNFFLKTL